jgi:hypothetical protein
MDQTMEVDIGGEVHTAFLGFMRVPTQMVETNGCGDWLHMIKATIKQGHWGKKAAVARMWIFPVVMMPLLVAQGGLLEWICSCWQHME